MKFARIFAFATPVLLAAACNGHPEQVELVPSSGFEKTVDGKEVGLYTLKAGNIIAQFTNYGGRGVSLFTPDRHGKMADIVVGHNNVDDYITPPGERFLGGCVGPVANRIGGAGFALDGQTYTLPKNDNDANTLHGGYNGLDRVVWDVVFHNDSTLVLHYLHPDGQEGYPGNLDITMIYSLNSNNEFKVEYSAVTDKATPVNISHHPFFNLRGEGEGTVEDYVMYIKASSYTPIDTLSIPSGEIASVEGTPFDFRKPHTIGQFIGEENEQLSNGRGYDHNWCIDKEGEGIELVCSVYDPQTGRKVEVLTDQPGLQFYSGNFFDGQSSGKNGKPLEFRSSLALETQHYPDSPNHDNFPSIILRPGETYTHNCIYRMSAE